MTIRFKCPHCQKPLSVKDHLAGKRAPCPACKEVLRIPVPVAPTPAPDAASAVDVEALAASALADEAAPPPAEEDEAKPIIFTCNWCNEEVQMPLEMAGKQAPCPNPECKRIIKVPLPKQEKPKDWREIVRKGPSAALANMPEKLDGVMGSPDDKGKVSNRALLEAGVLKLPPKPSIGTRGWVRRGLWGTVIVCGFVALVAVGNWIKFEQDMETPPFPSEEEFKEKKYTSPVLAAELYLRRGLYLIRGNYPNKAKKEFMNARGRIPRDPSPQEATVDRDLFLGELAVAQVELGGSDADVMDKSKLPWPEAYKEIGQTLDLIKAPEARALALREVMTRLLEKDQATLAIGLAGKMRGSGGPLVSQTIAIAVARDEKKLLDELPKEPEPAKVKEVTDRVARVGYAEGLARKGKFEEALELAKANGPLPDKLEACVGAAAVILASGKGKEAADKARPFVDDGLKAADAALAAAAQKKAFPPSPWQLLMVLRLGGRLQLRPWDELDKMAAALPPEFQPRGKLELFMARCETAKESLEPPRPEDLKKDETTMGLAFEAAGRQNAWCGQSDDLLQRTAEGEEARYRPLVLLGLAVGQRWPRP